MTFDFDKELPLKGARNQKHDLLPSRFGLHGDDAIPMWVADMDFAAAPCILDALQVEIDRGYMGYFAVEGPVSDAIVTWMQDRHQLTIDPDHIRYTRGVIEGLALALQALTQPDDGIIVFSPVYHSFFGKIGAMGRRVVESPLVLTDGAFHMDLAALEASLTGAEKMVVLCSPHNPGGRLWSPEELRDLADFCLRHDLYLVSDEIHMDLVFPGSKHHSTLVAAPQISDRTVIISAASKGFNIAGGETAFAVVPNDALRARFDAARRYMGGTPCRSGMLMMEAAFSHGGDWSDALCQYLADNFTLWRDRISAIPGVSVMDQSATYLTWVDFTGTGLEEDQISDRIIRQARVAPSPGTQFGQGGDLHRRFNIAAPRKTVLTAIERIEDAFSDLQ